jgi:hypothetical protein
MGISKELSRKTDADIAIIDTKKVHDAGKFYQRAKTALLTAGSLKVVLKTIAMGKA